MDTYLDENTRPDKPINPTSPNAKIQHTFNVNILFKNSTYSIMHLCYISDIDSCEPKENKFKCIQPELRRHLTFKLMRKKC